VRKFILSVLAIILALGLAGTGALAYFSDTETSMGNTYTAGTFDLKVADPNQDGAGYDGVSQTWVMSNMIPGTSTVSSKVWFRNAGSIPANHLEIAVSNTVIDGPGPESDTEEGTTDMARVIEITSMKYTPPAGTGPVIDCLAWLTDKNGNGIKDLDDLQELGIDSLPPPKISPFITTELEITLKFHSSADNDYQGDTFISTFTFTLNQDSSQ